jgi:NhaA family Na+:H+ antiporter
MTTLKLLTVFRALNPRRIVDAGLEFLRLEAAGGIILVAVALSALIVANSPLAGFYDYILNQVKLGVGVSDTGGFSFGVEKSIHHWINDGLMVLFFLLIGLEIKREVMVGELASRKKAMLPLFAAAGGMVVPALIYVFVNQDNPEFLRGWAIPCATDIAFALGILSLLGNRVPVSIKILLLATAIIDDLGAIIIIALFYTDDLQIYPLFIALLPIAVMLVMNRTGVWRIAPYIVCGVILWAAILKSGVHATLAGVITAMFIPLHVQEERRCPALRLEGDLHPWVVFIIMPVFAFANAGVSFAGMGFHSLMHPVTLGIILGLVYGKQIGIFGFIWLSVKAGFAKKPEGASWMQIYGMSVLCGVGFTMSLFIGGLAFADPEMQTTVRLGVLTGSFISAITAYIIYIMPSNKGNAAP